eukprot:225063-Amphidinium_carterae.2
MQHYTIHKWLHSSSRLVQVDDTRALEDKFNKVSLQLDDVERHNSINPKASRCHERGTPSHPCIWAQDDNPNDNTSNITICDKEQHK